MVYFAVCTCNHIIPKNIALHNKMKLLVMDVRNVQLFITYWKYAANELMICWYQQSDGCEPGYGEGYASPHSVGHCSNLSESNLSKFSFYLSHTKIYSFEMSLPCFALKP